MATENPDGTPVHGDNDNYTGDNIKVLEGLEAVRLRPDQADARVDYGDVLAQLGRVAEGIREYRQALRLKPGAADVHNNLGGLLAESGNLAEARAEFEEALRIKPDYGDARDNLERVRALESKPGIRP